MQRRGSLTIVGTGIRLIVQLTPEAREEISAAEKLLYHVADPVMNLWFCRLNSTAESLGHYYSEGKRRLETYNEMVDRILTCIRMEQRVCVALYWSSPGFVDT